MNTFIKDMDIKSAMTLKEACDKIMEKTKEVPKMTEEKKQERLRKIMAKLKSGIKLTDEDLSFLKSVDRILYMQALRVQKMAEDLENDLKHAKSKEEADRIISHAMAGISDKDPDREYLVASVNRISTEFRRSKQYHRLPVTEKEGDKKKKTDGKNPFKAEDEENAKTDQYAWSPIQEVLERMPIFNAQG